MYQKRKESLSTPMIKFQTLARNVLKHLDFIKVVNAGQATMATFLHFYSEAKNSNVLDVRQCQAQIKYLWDILLLDRWNGDAPVVNRQLVDGAPSTATINSMDKIFFLIRLSVVESIQSEMMFGLLGQRMCQ